MSIVLLTFIEFWLLKASICQILAQGGIATLVPFNGSFVICFVFMLYKLNIGYNMWDQSSEPYI